jgi:SAM-dependent methyltransferase
VLEGLPPAHRLAADGTATLKGAMERAEYDKLDRVEERMWWFAAAHANLLTLYRRSMPNEGGGAILDAGCGTGGFLARLAALYPEHEIVGLDADAEACSRAAQKSGRPVCVGSVNALPFADGAFAAIFSLDVLCHAGVDERQALAQFRRCLADDGQLVLNLPAYRWMLSRHDRAVHNTRRYTRSGLAAQLRAAGFRTLLSTYWNTLLFPLMAARRKLFSGHDEAASDVQLYPAPIEAACRAASRIEHALLDAGFAFPFGGSVITIAAKEGAANG